MTTPTTILHSRSDILTALRQYVGGVTVTDNQLITALNITLASWGEHTRSPHCYTITLTCGCSQVLPCCGLDDIEIWASDCDGCQYKLNNYDIRCNTLYTPDNWITGPATLIAYTCAPEQPLNTLSLLKNFNAGDTTIAIGQDFGLLPPAGWVKVCDSWYEYKCWSKATITPDRIDIANAAGDVSNIDPAIFRDVDFCGTATILSMVTPHCTNLTNSSHAEGSIVELGISTTSKSSLDFIVSKSLSEVYLMLAMACTSDEKSAFFFALADRQDARAKEARKRASHRRTVNVKVKEFAASRRNFRRGFADDIRYYTKR